MDQASSASRGCRSVRAQTLLLGFVCFCVPGMWNAITSMAGGISDKAVASQAMAALYACFAASSLLAPVATNLLGGRATLFAGCLGYIVYVLALLAHGPWGALADGLLVAAGALNGICAGLLWTAQGALIMSYPTREAKASYLALFWIVFNSGAVAGGLLSFGLNFDEVAREATSGTFVAFALVMLLGSLLCWTLSPLHLVVRSDGSRVELQPSHSVGTELWGMLASFSDRRVLALLPLFAYSNWFYAYQFTCYNARLFDTRTQGLNNALYWGAQMLGAWVLGVLLDLDKLPLAARAWISLASLAAIVGISWFLGIAANDKYGLDGTDVVAIDFNDVDYIGPLLLYGLWGFSDALVQCWSYWLMGQLEESAEKLSRLAGVYKSVQSLGAACSWALSTGAAPPSVQAYANAALFLAALPGAAYVSLRCVGSTSSRIATKER